MKAFYGIISLMTIFSIFSPAKATAAEAYTNITSRQAHKIITSGEKDLLILDVRTEGEYRDGHIRNALLIPVQTLAGRLDEIRKYRNKTIIVHCAVGGRSSRAVALLSSNGFSNVYNMTGGIMEWSKLGFELVR